MTPEEVVRTVTTVLTAQSDVEGLLLVGSATRRPDLPKNLDFLAITSCDPLAYHAVVKELLFTELDTIDVLFSDDSAIFTMASGAKLGIATCLNSTFTQRMHDYANGQRLEGQRRVWAPGYWLPEGFCADIADARILIDTQGYLAEVKGWLTTYPPQLACAVLALCKEEVYLKLPRISESIHPVTRASSITDVALALIRLAFASNRIYLHGFHHLEAQSRRLNTTGQSLVRLANQLVSSSELDKTIASIREEVVNAIAEYDRSSE